MNLFVPYQLKSASIPPTSFRACPCRSRRSALCAQKPEQGRRDAERAPATAPSKDPPVNVELFETAGTNEDRSSGWEPLGSDASSPGPLHALLKNIDFSEPMSFDGEEKTEYDPLRDGPLRYLGYANELGEAFAAWLFAGGVPLSYAVAIGYVLFDTYDKYTKTLADAETKLSQRVLPAEVDVGRLVATIGAERGVDTMVWQLIASVAAPGYTIHTVVAVVRGILDAAEEQPPVRAALGAAAQAVGAAPDAFLEAFNKSIPTAAGLLAIPFIVHPIDGAVHAMLNATLRPAMRRYICTKAGGREAGLLVCKDCEL